MKHDVLLSTQAKLKLAKFYYFSVSMAKSKQACGQGRETLKF